MFTPAANRSLCTLGNSAEWTGETTAERLARLAHNPDAPKAAPSAKPVVKFGKKAAR